MTLHLTPILNVTGEARIENAIANGGLGKIEYLAIGRGAYHPTGAEAGLFDEIARAEIEATRATVDGVEVIATITAPSDEDVWELAFLLEDGTPFAIHSEDPLVQYPDLDPATGVQRADGNGDPIFRAGKKLAYLREGAELPIRYVIDINVYGPDKITVVTSPLNEAYSALDARVTTVERRSVSSVATANSMNLDVGKLIYVEGYASPGDLGHHWGIVEGVSNVLYPYGGHIRPLSMKISAKMFGAKGDGVADDSIAIQQAYDFTFALGGGTVFFPAGTYMCTMIQTKWGVWLEGDGGATLKQLPGVGKFSRMFTNTIPGELWDSPYDSPLGGWRNLTIDGNRENQGSYLNYELEQQHMIFLYADTAQAGRLRNVIEGCTFREGVADAVSIHRNTDTVVTNCWFENVFRGGIVLTGGWSKLRASNIRMSGNLHKSGVNIEVDGGGHNGSFASEILMSNFDMEGDLDISFHDAGSLLMDNIHMRRGAFTINSLGSRVRGTNCNFAVSQRNGVSNRIVNPRDVRLSNSTFTLVEKSELGDVDFACVDVYWSVSGAVHADQLLELHACDFEVGEGVDTGDTTYGIFSQPDYASRNNRLVVQDCRFDKALDYGIWQQQGGTVEAVDNYYDCGTALRIASGSTFYSNVTVDGGRVGPNCATYATINNSASDNVILFRDVTLDEADNVLVSAFGVAGNTYRGSRRIIADNTPATAAIANRGGFVGDIWQLRTPVAGSTWQWVCTVSSHSSATWKALTAAAA